MRRNLNEILEDLEIKEQVAKLPFYKGSQEIDFEAVGLPPFPKEVTEINSKDERLAGNYISVQISDFGQLKSLVGVSEKWISKNKEVFLSEKRGKAQEEFSLREQAYAYLTGPLLEHVDRKVLSMPKEAIEDEVIAYIMKNVKELPVFLAEEVVISEGETRSIQGTALLVINRLRVVGNGKIDFSNNGDIKIVTKELVNK